MVCFEKYALGLTIVLLSLLLAGCGIFDPVNKAMNQLRPAEAADPARGSEDPFTVELSVPKRAGLDETFTLIASLHNLSKTRFELQSRPRVFHYLIVDSSGNRVNTISEVDSAVVRSMGGETDINEFSKPGSIGSGRMKFMRSPNSRSKRTASTRTTPTRRSITESKSAPTADKEQTRRIQRIHGICSFFGVFRNRSGRGPARREGSRSKR
ncbi:hypothetical protein HMSSN139_43220 [Paenibacillus sp. HMSSN-139]|nr:hypothetical protein HMSSN139_43220 [Paenibacillus sp. HMSSN-139]